MLNAIKSAIERKENFLEFAELALEDVQGEPIDMLLEKDDKDIEDEEKDENIEQNEDSDDEENISDDSTSEDDSEDEDEDDLMNAPISDDQPSDDTESDEEGEDSDSETTSDQNDGADEDNFMSTDLDNVPINNDEIGSGDDLELGDEDLLSVELNLQSNTISDTIPVPPDGIDNPPPQELGSVVTDTDNQLTQDDLLNSPMSMDNNDFTGNESTDLDSKDEESVKKDLDSAKSKLNKSSEDIDNISKTLNESYNLLDTNINEAIQLDGDGESEPESETDSEDTGEEASSEGEDQTEVTDAVLDKVADADDIGDGTVDREKAEKAFDQLDKINADILRLKANLKKAIGGTSSNE